MSADVAGRRIGPGLARALVGSVLVDHHPQRMSQHRAAIEGPSSPSVAAQKEAAAAKRARRAAQRLVQLQRGGFR